MSGVGKAPPGGLWEAGRVDFEWLDRARLMEMVSTAYRVAAWSCVEPSEDPDGSAHISARERRRLFAEDLGQRFEELVTCAAEAKATTYTRRALQDVPDSWLPGGAPP